LYSIKLNLRYLLNKKGIMKNEIAIKALFYTERNQQEILVFEDFDKIKKQFYYRPIGGTVEFGEKTIDTLNREVMEETGEKITVDKLLLITENLFNLNGDSYHEIVYIYQGSFITPKYIQQDQFWITESNGERIKCLWVDKSEFKNNKLYLVPEGLLTII